MSVNRQWILRKRPVGEISPGDLEFVETPIRALAAGEVLVRNIYLSLDPTNRIWMSDQDQYMPPVQIGDAMRGGGLIAPAILDAQAMDPDAIMDAMRDIVARTRTGRLRNSEITRGTITVRYQRDMLTEVRVREAR